MIDDDALRRIENLHRLKVDGVITQEEFDMSKADLLSRNKTPVNEAQVASPKEPLGLPPDDDYFAWVFLPLRRYADFNGRSTRKEFWMFQLLYVALALGTITLIIAIGADAAASLLLLSLLGLVVPMIAVEIRRFHDQDKSGWFALLNLVPYVGPLIVFAMMLIDGTRGENRFGPDPLDRW